MIRGLVFLMLFSGSALAQDIVINSFRFGTPATIDTVKPVAATDTVKYSTSVTSFSVPFTVSGDANLILIYTYAYAGSALTVDSVEWYDNNWTLVCDTGSTIYQTAVFYILNPTPGSDTVKVFWNTSVSELALGISSWKNVHSTTPLGGYAAFYLPNTIDSIYTTVSAAAGDIVWSGVGYYRGTSISYGAGQTEIWQTPYTYNYAMTAGSSKPGESTVNMVTRFAVAADYSTGVTVPIKHK
jgi:hypothetical protein